MKEFNVELLVTKAKELYPDAKPRIIHDNGKQDVGDDFHKLLTQLEIADSKTRPFHPQSNGKV
jgi:transposase InsO family protein